MMRNMIPTIRARQACPVGRVIGLGLCSLSIILLAGCVSSGQSKLADPEVMGQIKTGETTKEQVASLLGEPEFRRSINLSESVFERWHYRYTDSKVNVLDYLLLYGFLFNGVGTPDTDYILDVFYGSTGVVTTKRLSTTLYDMGNPITPLAVKSTVSTDSLPGGTGQPVHWEEQIVGRRPPDSYEK